MTRERHRIKYRAMEILDRFGLLDFTYSIYLRGDGSNPFIIMRNVRQWIRGAPDGLPIPPTKLINIVAGTWDIRWFLEGGKLAAESIKSILEKNGVDIQDLGEILDFGCGCGRVMRFLKGKAGLYGTDYNRELIKWCKKNVSFAHFDMNRLEPPLGYHDEKFDFIYALSVFTHLPEAVQQPWIEELRRILKPGGLLLITTHGEKLSCPAQRLRQREV